MLISVCLHIENYLNFIHIFYIRSCGELLCYSCINLCLFGKNNFLLQIPDSYFQGTAPIQYNFNTNDS